MNITFGTLLAAGIAPTPARAFADPLAAACARFDINTPARIAGFVAQCRAESAGFTALEENLYYTSPERIRRIFPSTVPDLEVAARIARNAKALANRVYGGRLGNGPESSGDGWRFRGRGLFQLTGRANYMAAGDGLGTDYKVNPDLVAEPPDAAFTAAWYWAVGNLNAMADVGQIDVITRRINGPAMLGADERRALYQRFLQVLA